MPLQPGTTLGPYAVTAKIGEGGMGEVYRARDTKLDRDVALKVLPDAFTADPDRLARFEREAKVLASLNHPNIGAIYGLEKSGDTRALVLELIEGPTLADRIKRGPIPLDEALSIAKQIAEALEAAHEAGVIHRDLKPANIKVREDGTVKVLDFGLAKALDPTPEGDPSQSPTLTAAATQMGVIMGTAAYMSPEQARGKVVDKRADIWAFGVVLYEILAGSRPFQGEDESLTLASVLNREPQWDGLPHALSPALNTYLRRCLEKEPRQRVQAIGDVRLAMEGAFETPPETRPQIDVPSTVWQRPASVVLGVLLVVATTSLAWWLIGSPSRVPTDIARFSIPLLADQSFNDTSRHLIAFSPDGTRLVYQADGQLFVRRMDELQATPIPGTEGGATNPFVSTDGTWVGFWAGDQLRKVAMSGGAAVTLCSARNPWGASWSRDDTILVGQGFEGIWRVPSAGGTPEVVIEVAEGEIAHGPQLLPGGDWVLFTLSPVGATSWNEAKAVVQSLSSGERAMVVDPARDARYVQTGHLVYALDGVLFAVPFDAASRQVTGGPVPLVGEVADAGSFPGTHFTVSESGSLVYVHGPGLPRGGAGQASLGWVDRGGNMVPAVEDWNVFGHPRLSPDDERVAVAVAAGDFPDIWIREFATGLDTRLTDDGLNLAPTWTPDGTQLTFASARVGDGDIYMQAVDRISEATSVVTGSSRKAPGDWSPDGEMLVYAEDGSGNRDIWIAPLDGEPVPFLATESDESSPRLSSDGRWVAYVSDQTGAPRVYVQSFPDGGRIVPISAGVGAEPVWSRTGDELFYRNRSQMVAVEFSTEPEFRVEAQRVLFEDVYQRLRIDGVANYDVSLDGERFLMVVPTVDDAGPLSFTLVQHWFEDLRQRVPVD